MSNFCQAKLSAGPAIAESHFLSIQVQFPGISGMSGQRVQSELLSGLPSDCRAQSGHKSNESRR